MFEIVIGDRRFALPGAMVNTVLPCAAIVRPATPESGLAMLPSGSVAVLISLANSPVATLDLLTGDEDRTLIEIDAISDVGGDSNEKLLTLELIDELKRESRKSWTVVAD